MRTEKGGEDRSSGRVEDRDHVLIIPRRCGSLLRVKEVLVAASLLCFPVGCVFARARASEKVSCAARRKSGVVGREASERGLESSGIKQVGM